MLDEKKRLSDIFGGLQDSLSVAWDSTEAAEELHPIRAGVYVCRAKTGELFFSSHGTPGYKIAFVILEGEYAGRIVWHDCWLTDRALPMTKRDLAKLRITKKEQLDLPLPQGFRCRVNVAMRQGDDGAEYNRVTRFAVIGKDENAVDDPDFPPTARRAAGPDDGDDGFDAIQ